MGKLKEKHVLRYFVSCINFKLLYLKQFLILLLPVLLNCHLAAHCVRSNRANDILRLKRLIYYMYVGMYIFKLLLVNN